jgi:hypothetical protein
VEAAGRWAEAGVLKEWGQEVLVGGPAGDSVD